MAACLRFTRRVWRSFLDNQGHDSACFPNLKIESAVPGSIHVSLKIEDRNLNRVRTVHGGLLASLTDTLGSLAIGVSTDIGTSFVKGAGTTGDVLFAKGFVVGLGRSLAYTRVEFMNSNGQLLAFGHHTKYIGKSHDNPKNVKFSEDGETVTEGEDIKED
ncbi:thioesterase thiol ester dehydrase-isomerase [Hysterangium stoloniferum]|nr:thioesterase thiol ester dehydrase-isomerase [Hysterangium stoloniferum]